MNIYLPVTESLLAKLEELRVYSYVNNGGKRLKAGDTIHFDTDSIIEPYTAFCSGFNLNSMGAFSYSWAPLDILQKVGRYCSIAVGLKNFSVKHPLEHVSTSKFNDCDGTIHCQALIDRNAGRHKDFRLVPYDIGLYEIAEIGDDVWIGENVLLGRNIRIGTGAVIGANSVVTKDVPPYAIVGGVPAKIIRYRFPEPVIEQLLASQWWKYHFVDFNHLSFSEPERFAGELQEEIAAGKIQEFKTDSRPFAERLLEKYLTSGETPPDNLAVVIETAKKRKTLNEQFPVPAACKNWHQAERDHRDGKLIRFFAHKAWLETEIDESATHLELLVNYEVGPGAITQLEVRLFGEMLRLTSITAEQFGRKKLQYKLPTNRPKGAARLELKCDYTYRPALMGRNSNDHRILSLAISKPAYVKLGIMERLNIFA